MSTTYTAPNPVDVFGSVAAFLVEHPVPDAVTVSVSLAHGPSFGAQVQIHGTRETAGEFVDAAIEALELNRPVGVPQTYTDEARAVRTHHWDTATDEDTCPAHLRGGLTLTFFEQVSA